MTWKPKYKETRDKVKLAVRLYKSDMPVPQIAEQLEVRPRMIYRYLDSAGIKLRERNRDNKGRFTS